MHPTFLPFHELCVRYIVTNSTEIYWSQWVKSAPPTASFFTAFTQSMYTRSCQPCLHPPTPHPWRHRTLAKCDVQHGKKIHITRKRVTADSDILTCLSFVQSCPACRTHGISPSVIWETGCYVQTKHNGTLANESHTGSSTVAQHGMAFTKHNKHGTVSLRSPVSTQSSIKRLILHISLKLVNSLR